MRLTKLLPLVLLAACNPFTFDDLEETTWLRIVGRDSAQNEGDFGISLSGIKTSTGTTIVVGGGAPAGLSTLTFGPDGELISYVGFDAREDAAHPLAPLNRDSGPEGIADTGDGRVLVGAPQQNAVILYQVTPEGVKLGQLISPPMASSPVHLGRFVAAGNLGLGDPAIPDAVALADTALVVLPDLSSTDMRQCAVLGTALQVVRRPGDSTDSVLLAAYHVEGGTTTIGEVRLFSASDVAGGACPGEGTSMLINGVQPKSVAAGQLDGAGGLDLVAGTGSSAVVFLDEGASTVTVLPPADATPVAFGTTVAVGNVDADGNDELVVGDPNGVVGGETAAGRVDIFDVTTGGATKLSTVFEPGAEQNNRFGRSLAFAPFTTGAGTTSVLVVGGKDNAYVYYRVSAASPDPRE
jgi:hypothetical protein